MPAPVARPLMRLLSTMPSLLWGALTSFLM